MPSPKLGEVANVGGFDFYDCHDNTAVRRRADLKPVQTGDANVVLAAARLGATRLIDNLEV